MVMIAIGGIGATIVGLPALGVTLKPIILTIGGGMIVIGATGAAISKLTVDWNKVNGCDISQSDNQEQHDNRQ
jgi:hypothetical protein